MVIIRFVWDVLSQWYGDRGESGLDGVASQITIFVNEV
jgi:hypothetical protein